MHTLLRRQLRRFGLEIESIPPDYVQLIEAASDAYDSFDDDRLMLERSLEISSKESLAINESVRSSGLLLNAILDSTADGILAVRADGLVVHSNARFAELWGIPPEILKAKDDAALLAFVVDQVADPAEFIRTVDELYRSSADRLDSVTFKDGRIFERYSRPLLDANGIAGRVWSFRDVTAQRRLEEALRHQGLHDPLTGLANRVLFSDRVAQALDRSRRTQRKVAVLFVDVDNFKSVNDAFGHSTGDGLLVGISARLQSLLRPGDTVARFGGDEFTLVLEDLEADEALAAGTRIVAALGEPFKTAEREIVVHASAGVAMGIGGKVSADGLISDADAAMYAAKTHGKGRVEFYDDRMHSMVHTRMQLLNDLQGAVERREFILEYQPIFDLERAELNGVEALVRWRHPERGLVPPLDFIHLAEESGMMPELGEWILREACRQLELWQADFPEGGALHMSVNVSVRQLQPGFGEIVAAALSDHGIAPESLILEMTESVMAGDDPEAAGRLRELKMLGVRLAIDDFGTGYSSLSYLQQFPFDILKIDKSFVDDESEELHHPLTAAIVDMGRRLNLELIAEGIENVEQLDRLVSMSCDMGQGFYLARPCLAKDIETLLRKRKHPGYAA